MIEGISAVTLTTHDMACAVRFYCMLGFELVHGGEDAQRAVHAPPVAPTLVELADDPQHEKCFEPDSDQGQNAQGEDHRSRGPRGRRRQ